MFEVLLIIGIIFYIHYKNNNSDNAKNKKYDRAKKEYSEDCKKFDKITSLNDGKYKAPEIIQNDAIKSFEDDFSDSPIKEYNGHFRKRPNSNL